MNVAQSKDMTTQAWQPPSAQSSSTIGGPQGQWPSTSATQSQGMPTPLYASPSNLPPSPSTGVPPFRAPSQANSESLNSQPPLPPTPSPAASLPQGGSTTTSAVGQANPGYVTHAPSFSGPRWPPPTPIPQTGSSVPVAQTGLPAPIPQSSTPGPPAAVSQPPAPTVQVVPVSQSGLRPSQGLGGSPAPLGLPWHPLPSGPFAVSAPPTPTSNSAPQDSPGGRPPPVPPGVPSVSTTIAPTQTGPSALAVPSVALGSTGLPPPSAPPGLASLSVSQVPVIIQTSTSGAPGLPGNASTVSSGSSMSIVSGPSVPLGVSESSTPPGPPAAPGISNSSSLHGSSPMTNAALAPPGPPGVSPVPHPSSAPSGQRASIDTSISGLRPPTNASTVPASTSMSGSSITPVAQLPQYVPYISVPPVPPPLSPWTFQPQAGVQLQARPPFPPFVNVPNPYLPPIRPAVSIQVGIGIATGKLPLDNTASLAPPGEQVPSDAAKLAPGQPVNGHSELSTKQEVADVWTAHKTMEGIIYYYNAVTGQSTYEKPPGFQGEVDKVTAQPTPVSWEMIGGTGWAMVTTNDAKRYYYHRESQATSWQVPPEVTEYRKKQIEESTVKSGTGGQFLKANSEKGTISFSLNAPGVGSSVHKIPTSAASSSALDLIKKKLQDSGIPASDNVGSGDGNKGFSSEGVKEKTKDNHAEKSSSESSSDSDDEERGPTKEERVAQFKEMLKEKGIVPFSKWEKELPKIIFDPRFKAIPSHTERRSIFDHYVRTRAEEERKEKRAAQRAAIEGFKQLLDEASKDINHNLDYERFAKAWGADPRFEALERKDREMLLNERVLPLRKAEEERIRAIQTAAIAGFKAMLMEIGEVNSSSRWSRIKDKLRNDARYRTVKREEREALFNEYVAELRAVEQEAERAVKAKREEEEKVKERERERRKRKERDEQEMEKARVKSWKREATTLYQALLMEKVKDPEASWTESRPKLEKDPLGRATNPELDDAEREKMFREHVHALYDRAVRDYRALLADTLSADAATKQNEEGKSMLNSWSEAKKHLKSDPRYGKMPRRERESWWRRYAEDIQHKLKIGSNSSKEDRHSGPEAGKASALEGGRKNSSRR